MDTTLETTRRGSWDAVKTLIPAVAALVLVIYLYWGTFTWWWWEWTYPGSFYAHAVFVPFFVVAMIWRDREKLAAAPYDPSWLGMAYLIPSVLLLLVARKGDITTVESLSFMLLVLGASTMIVGKTRTRMLMFPLLFIMLMMPLVPDQLINSIAFPIQLTSAKIATFLLNALTLHSTRIGTLIQMDSYKLSVELPCSGFKTLVSLLTFTAAFAYLTDAANWKRWTLFMTTIPLSLVINALRITLIGIVGELVSSKAAATFHDYSGFIVLILAFTFLFNFAKILRCERFLGFSLDDPPNDPKVTRPKADTGESAEPATAEPEAPWWQPLQNGFAAFNRAAAHAMEASFRVRSRTLPFMVGLIAFLLSVVVVQAVVLKPIVPQPPISRRQVPMEFTAPGRTPGQVVKYVASDDAGRDKLTKVVLETLNPSRVISRVYRGSDGSSIELFMTSGSGRHVFHDPHTCMLGSDALLTDVGEIDIPSPNGTVRVLETRFKTGLRPEETEMLVCYLVDGKMVPRTEDVRNRIILQTFFGDGGKPSYWLRVTQRSAGTDEEKRQQAINFVSGLWTQIGPILEGKVPGAVDAKPESIAEGETPVAE
jgi:exosortase